MHLSMTDPGAGCGSPTGDVGTEEAEDRTAIIATMGGDDGTAFVAPRAGTGACGTELADYCPPVITCSDTLAPILTVDDVLNARHRSKENDDAEEEDSEQDDDSEGGIIIHVVGSTAGSRPLVSA